MDDNKKRTELILCIFLGWFGAHKFYTGKIGMGILYFFTTGMFLVGWIYDIATLSLNYKKEYVKLEEDEIDKIVLENPRNRTASIKQYRKITGENFKNASVEIDNAYERTGINPYKKLCPKCKSGNCTAFLETREIAPEKRIVEHSANLNPLKPFTFVNSNEKVVRRSISKTYTKFVCNDCGKIFE